MLNNGLEPDDLVTLVLLTPPPNNDQTKDNLSANSKHLTLRDNLLLLASQSGADNKRLLDILHHKQMSFDLGRFPISNVENQGITDRKINIPNTRNIIKLIQQNYNNIPEKTDVDENPLAAHYQNQDHHRMINALDLATF
jgi:hypothetical protein